VRDGLNQITAVTHESVAGNADEDDGVIGNELDGDEADFDVGTGSIHDDNSLQNHSARRRIILHFV